MPQQQENPTRSDQQTKSGSPENLFRTQGHDDGSKESQTRNCSWSALALTTTNSEGKPWDFNDSAPRTEAENILDEQRPQLRIGSPICTAFSNIQDLNKAKRNPAVVEAEIEKARVYLNWCC